MLQVLESVSSAAADGVTEVHGAGPPLGSGAVTLAGESALDVGHSVRSMMGQRPAASGQRPAERPLFPARLPAA